jgi:hypothetical protein
MFFVLSYTNTSGEPPNIEKGFEKNQLNEQLMNFELKFSKKKKLN